jgi:hypothetical protein
MARSGRRRIILAICAIAALPLIAPMFAQAGGVVVVRGGGYYGGYRGYYGYRGWYGGYYPWGWRPYFAILPYYYAPYGYGGGPYYYAGYTYILPSPAVGPYNTVALGAPSGRRPVWTELIVYPKHHQSQNQQVRDRYECYRWSVSQLGYDPTSAGGGTVRGDLTDYNRAQAACLTARGYSVQ